MSELSLYKYCLHKVATFLRDGTYKTYPRNPFSAMPYHIVDDLASVTIAVYRKTGLSAFDLELLLTSGRLREFKIINRDEDEYCEITSQILRFLMLGCQNLEVLHLTDINIKREPIPDIDDYLNNILRNSPNLKDLVSSSPFDLKSLRNCKKLRSLRLLFETRQSVCEFLEKDNNHFQPHKHLKYFSVFPADEWYIPREDVVNLLRHCPELTSLGMIEALEVLSLLQKMHFPPSELKLRHCCFADERYSVEEDKLLKLDGEIKDAVQYYPVIEELELHVFSIKTIPHLKNLKNLVYLNVSTLLFENSGEVFEYSFKEIGSRLKHLAFHVSFVDISILLQHCPNLESLGIFEPISASSVVHLPLLQRLCISSDSGYLNVEHIISQFSGCNQLTDLFLNSVSSFDDKTLNSFLKRNSLSNLKVAYIRYSSLTELGFRELLLNAIQLERANIFNRQVQINFKEVATELNHKVIYDRNLLSMREEFFQKRFYFDCYGV